MLVWDKLKIVAENEDKFILIIGLFRGETTCCCGWLDSDGKIYPRRFNNPTPLVVPEKIWKEMFKVI